MAGFGGVQEEGRRAGAREGRGDLAADVPGFAHAGDDDPSLAGEGEAAGGREAEVDARFEGPEGTQLRGKGAPAGVHQTLIGNRARVRHGMASYRHEHASRKSR